MCMLIKNGQVVLPNGVWQADVLVRQGKIAAVSPGLKCDGATVLDAGGCLVFPGFIDTHTHFDLELATATAADDFVTGTKAALLGGTTTVLDFATQQRDGTLQTALEQWHKKAQGSSCDYGFHMAIARWDADVAAEIPRMTEQGVTSYKMYMVYDGLKMDDGAIYRALKYTRDKGCLIGMHCENWDLLLAMIEEQKALGHTDPTGHPASRPGPMEAEAVNRYLRLAELAKAPAYIVHLSTAQGLLEAELARKRGQQVYLETCPQYLLLDDSRYADPDGAKFVMSPPLRKKEDNEALWAGLQSAAIQTIGTDHCPFTMADKALGKDDFSLIPNGGAGVQTRAQLIYTYGVLAGRITLPQMAQLLSTNAASLFGMLPEKGAIVPGADADIVIWDPDHQEVLSHKTLAHHCDNTPFEGFPVQGYARDVLLRGQHVVQNGTVVAPGKGQYVHRHPSGQIQ